MDEVTAENEDVSQVAGATGVGAGLSGHRSTAWLATTTYCVCNKRLREYLTSERSRVQDRDMGLCESRLCELSWFQCLTSSKWIKLHVFTTLQMGPNGLGDYPCAWVRLFMVIIIYFYFC